VSSTDAVVTVSADFSENGVNKTATATVTVKATVLACPGNARNQSAITIVGNTTKQLGETLDVNYCLKNFNTVSRFDVYLALQLPDSTMMYMQPTGLFLTPIFTTRVAPYLSNTLIPDKSGSALSAVLPQSLALGTYTFYVLTVQTGKDVYNPAFWVGNLDKKQVELTN